MILKIVLVCLVCAVNARPKEITLSDLLRNSSVISDDLNTTLEASPNEESSNPLSKEKYESQILSVKVKREDDGGDGGGDEDIEGEEDGFDSAEGEESEEDEIDEDPISTGHKSQLSGDNFTSTRRESDSSSDISDSTISNDDIPHTVYNDGTFRNQAPLLSSNPQLQAYEPVSNENPNKFGSNFGVQEETFPQEDNKESNIFKESVPSGEQIKPITTQYVDHYSEQNNPSIHPQDSQFQPCQTENCRNLHNTDEQDSGKFSLSSFTRPEHEEGSSAYPDENSDTDYNPIKLFPVYTQNQQNQENFDEIKGNSETYENTDNLQHSSRQENFDFKNIHPVTIPGDADLSKTFNTESSSLQNSEQRSLKSGEGSKVTFVTISPEEFHEENEADYFEPENEDTDVEYVEEIYLEPIDAENANKSAEEDFVDKHTVLVKENGDVIVNTTNKIEGLISSGELEKNDIIPENGDIVELIHEIPVNLDTGDSVNNTDLLNENDNSQSNKDSQNVPNNVNTFDQTSNSNSESSDIFSNTETSSLNVNNGEDEQDTFEETLTTEPDEYYESEYEDEDNDSNESSFDNKGKNENIGSKNKRSVEQEKTLKEEDKDDDDDDDTEDTIFGYNSTQTFFYAGGKGKKLDKRDLSHFENSTVVEEEAKNYEEIEQNLYSQNNETENENENLGEEDDHNNSDKRKIRHSSTETPSQIPFIFEHNTINLFYTFFLNSNKSLRQSNIDSEPVDHSIYYQVSTENPSIDQEPESASFPFDRKRRQADFAETSHDEEAVKEILHNSSNNQENYFEHENDTQKEQIFLPDNETEATTENLFIFEKSDHKPLISNRNKKESDITETPYHVTTEGAYPIAQVPESDNYHFDRKRRQAGFTGAPHDEEATKEILHNSSNNQENYPENENNTQNEQIFLPVNETETTTENLFIFEKPDPKSVYPNRNKRETDITEIPYSEEDEEEEYDEEQEEQEQEQEEQEDSLLKVTESENSDRVTFDVSQDNYATTETSDFFENNSSNGHSHSDRKRRQADFVGIPHVEENIEETLFNTTDDEKEYPENENSEKVIFDASQNDYTTTESSDSFESDLNEEHSDRKRRQIFLPANETETTTESLFIFENSDHKFIIPDRNKRESDITEIPHLEYEEEQEEEKEEESLLKATESENSEKVTIDVSQDNYATTETSDFFDHDSNNRHYHSNRQRRQAGLAESPHVEEGPEDYFFNSSSKDKYSYQELGAQKEQVFQINDTEVTTENLDAFEENSQHKYVDHNRKKRQGEIFETQHPKDITENPLIHFSTDGDYGNIERSHKYNGIPTETTTEIILDETTNVA